MQFSLHTFTSILACCFTLLTNAAERYDMNTSVSKTDTLVYPFRNIPVSRSLVKECKSEDGKVKFYSWQTNADSDLPEYSVLCQYVAADGTVRVVSMSDRVGGDRLDDLTLVRAVHSVIRNDDEMLYLIEEYRKTSATHATSSITTMRIVGDRLMFVGVQNGHDIRESEADLCVSYNVTEWYFATCGEGFDWLYYFDAEKGDLYVPEILDDQWQDGILTDRYFLYRFDGEKFKNEGIRVHRNIYSKLRQYRMLRKYLRTAGYLIRIDELEDGSLRLAQWKTKHSMDREPEVILLDGQYDFGTDTYTFSYKGTDFIVNDELTIMQGGRVLVKQPRIK